MSNTTQRSWRTALWVGCLENAFPDRPHEVCYFFSCGSLNFSSRMSASRLKSSDLVCTIENLKKFIVPLIFGCSASFPPHRRVRQRAMRPTASVGG